MERIMIIGCGGAGKSTLARTLGEITGLPVVHLDRIWWAPGNWQHIQQEEFDEKLHAELAKPRWILDGNFNRTLEWRLQCCDTVIYLDMPRLVCLKNWIGRVIKNRGTARADMAPGCCERFDPEMAGWIWRFNKNNRARYYALLENLEDTAVVILRSRKEVTSFLKERKGEKR